MSGHAVTDHAVTDRRDDAGRWNLSCPCGWTSEQPTWDRAERVAAAHLRGAVSEAIRTGQVPAWMKGASGGQA